MKKRYALFSPAVRSAGLAVLLCSAASPASAQWLKVPTQGIPRTADGKPDFNAPTPKMADGKPDISGLWEPADVMVGDIAKNLKPGSVPFRPWSEELYKHRRDTESKDDPTGWCVPGGVPRADLVPYPFKIVNTPNMVIILYEAVQSYRQIFTDGRALPKDPNPAWMGYSIGHWEADAFVVETAGFNDNVWLDNFGHPATEQLRVTERFKRKDFGHMDVEITIDDPKAYTKPWNVTLPLRLLPDTELLEYICVENNKDLEHLVGK
jgi:hypothetical protein